MFALTVFQERIVLQGAAEAADEFLGDRKEHKTTIVSVDAKTGTLLEIQFVLEMLRQNDDSSGPDESGFRTHLIEAWGISIVRFRSWRESMRN